MGKLVEIKCHYAVIYNKIHVLHMILPIYLALDIHLF